MSVETHLLYAVHGPIVAALLVSLRSNTVHSLQYFIFLFFCKNLLLFQLSAGELIFPSKYYKSLGYQIKRHASSRVQHVHESSASHPHLGAFTGNTVCHFSLEARESAGRWSLRVCHAYTYALPGEHYAAIWIPMRFAELNSNLFCKSESRGARLYFLILNLADRSEQTALCWHSKHLLINLPMINKRGI